MKMKNLLSVICAAIVGLASCTSETPIDELEQGVLPGQVAIRFAAGDILSTKAADGYTIADENEIKVNDFYVAIFDHNNAKIGSGVKVESTQGTLSEGVSTTQVTNEQGKEVAGYKVIFNNISSDTYGSNGIKALVVANASDLYSTFDACTTLDDFLAAKNSMTIKQTGYQVDASSLPKAGLSNLTLFDHTQSLTLTIPLVQQVARVDFGNATLDTKTMTKAVTETISYSDYQHVTKGLIDNARWAGLQAAAGYKVPGNDKTWEPDTYFRVDRGPYPDTGGWTVTDKTKGEGIIDKGDALYYNLVRIGSQSEWKVEDFSKMQGSYVYPGHFQKRILIVRRKVTYLSQQKKALRSEEGNEASFTLEKVSYSGNKKTNILVDGQANTLYEALSATFNGGNQTIYTCESPNNPLLMTLEGTYYPGDVSVQPDDEVIWQYGLWMQTRSENGWDAVSVVPDGSEGDSIDWLDVYDDVRLEPMLRNVQSNGATGIKKTYTLNWNNDVKDANGNPVVLKHGYRYTLNVSLKDDGLQFIVKIARWDVKYVDDVQFDSVIK